MFTTDAAKKIITDNPRSQREVEVDKVKKFEFLEYRYGTSGFRENSAILESIMVRVGLLAVLRSFTQNCGAVGLMVTASHNDEVDNGVKIIDPSGEMMEHSWETLATEMANKSEDEVLNFLQSKYEENQSEAKSNDDAKSDDNDKIPKVFIGRDTRPHSPKFAELIAKGAASINSKVMIKDFGEVTTPQLHYMVRRANSDIGVDKITTDIYLNDVLSSYKKLITLLGEIRGLKPVTKPLGDIMLDCANGVGGLPFKVAQEELKDVIGIDLIHMPSSKVKVNEKCGAEHIHKKRSIPIGLVGKENDVKDKRLASLDGDCDRLMYYYLDGNNNNKLEVCDGDKQICLFMEFMNPYIKVCGVELTIGVVQTGYANGASRNYITNTLGLKSLITPTGVKYLHHEAKNYDISVYYEANGHGTILVSVEAVKKLKNVLETGGDKVTQEQKNAIDVLLLVHEVANQAIGDALADLLMVEAGLYGLGWDIKKWNAIYVDRPSCLTKLTVKDRTAFITTNAEQTCVEPKGLQDVIDELCAKHKDSRGFVRPSGTEDCVRIYAEATTQEDADAVNLGIQRAVYDIAGGVGDRP
eukprot:468629_1